MLAISLSAVGQSSYIFHKLTTDDGLSNSTVRAILKDSYGLLWIGTESGLNRYDGYGFTVYEGDPEVENSLWINDIWGLHEDGRSNIWINSGFNYAVYNRDKDSFINDIPNLLSELGIIVDRNYKVHIDKHGDLWVLSGQEAFFYDFKKNDLKIFEINVQIGEVLINELCDDGNVLYSVLKSGQLWRIDKHSGAQSLVDLKDQPSIDNSSWYNRIYVDSREGIWLYSDKTDVIYYQSGHGSNWEKLQLVSSVRSQSNVVLDIMDDENGHIWIGTDHEGIFIYDKANKAFANLVNDRLNPSSIASNNVSTFFKDDRGILWMGHNKKGISYFHDSFRNFKSIVNEECRDISSILQDRTGNIWLGTDGNGLFVKKNALTSEIKKMPMPNYAIVSLIEDSKGRIWVGTYLNGLFCYENGKFVQFTKSNSKLSSNDIWSLEEDRYGNLWIGTLGGGIQQLQPDPQLLNSEIKTFEGIEYALDMYYDQGDKLYVCTVYGLCVIDIVTGKQVVQLGNLKGTQKFRKNLLLSAYKDDTDHLWLGHFKGLTVWDMKRDTLYHMDKENGLSDDIVRGFVEDDHHNMWVTTSNGLSVVSLEQGGRNDLKLKSTNFHTKDGLKDNYFNNHAICKLRNGDILLGGTDGYTIVNPNKLAEKNQPPPKVIFTKLSVANEKINVDSLYNGRKLLEHSMEKTTSLTFGHNDKLITFNYTTGDLLNAEKVRYAYYLQGFDNNWHNTQENKLAFSSLAPGKYKLYIKAANSDGFWSTDATLMEITVTPPLYLSGMAIMLYILGIIGAIFFLVHRTRKHHDQKYEEQRLKLEHEQEANLNEMKLRFFTNISHDLRTPLTLIITPLQSILNSDLEEGLRKKLVNINKNAEQLKQLISSLLDFRKLDAGAETLKLGPGEFVNFIKEICIPFRAYALEQQTKFTFSDEVKELSMMFDGNKVKKILFNLLSNAFKFTPAGGNIDVHLYLDEDKVCVSVSDSGEGISEIEKSHVFERFYRVKQKNEQSGSGLGLNIVQDYVHIHNGTITVMDNVPQGSIFTFKLPIVEIEQGDISVQTEPEQDQINEPEQTEDTQQLPVLLFVDDHEDFREFMSDSLKDEYNVLIASNGQEALEQLKNNDVNIVVSDVMMPVMSGTELCSRIKTDINWSHIPVILLTARTAEEYRIEGLEKGADDYLTKPFNFELLKLRIQKFLEWTEKSHTSFSQKIDVSPSEITITPLDEQLIEKAIRIVEEHMADADFSVEELSRDLGLSRSHLYKKLMVITGKGPAEFIRTIRLKRGRQLLEKSQLQIAEIAYAVGFNSPKRFAINFKNEFGASPSDYMRQLKQ